MTAADWRIAQQTKVEQTMAAQGMPYLPPRTYTVPTGWGTEADKLANLHGDHDHAGGRW
jgi:hypothetical protein